jgi:esterase
MELFFKKQGDGPALFILHGLFGSGDNWQSHANTLSSAFTVYLVDQRNHGRSPHSEVFSYPEMANDLMELIATTGEREVNLLGHSMGGKTALHFAQAYPWLIRKMIVADIGLKGYPPHHDEIFKALYAADIDHCGSRKEAEERMLPYIFEASTLQFLLKNIYWREPGRLAWRFNLPVLHSTIGGIIGPVPDGKIDTETLFLRGGKSKYIQPSDYTRILEQVPHSRIETLPEARHWLHAEFPVLFLEHVQRFLKEH